MTIQEFLSGNTLTAIEKTDDLIINLVVDESTYGLDVDTSSIVAGTVLERTTNFQIEGDLLTCEGITIDTTTINMLG
jgi:hypothetical protein